MPAGTYHVSVSSFEGPFDLLLQLIARRRLDVHQIPLAQITDDYLAVLRAGAFDLEVATEFLVVAATLIELKAARLLPSECDPEAEELALEARDLLYARLLDYRTFKEASGALRRALDANVGYTPRAALLEDRFAALRPNVSLPLDAEGLALLAARVLAEQPAPSVDLAHVQPLRMTVQQAADMVVVELERAGGRATFRELTAGCRHRAEVVVHFLALLELYKLEVVDLDQIGVLGDLVVTAEPDGDRAFSAPVVDDATVLGA